MHKSLVALVICCLLAGPAAAQTAPAPPAPPPAKPKMVKKTVCERVVTEETTGSRLGTAPKKCRTFDVPAPANGDTRDSAPPSERGD